MPLPLVAPLLALLAAAPPALRDPIADRISEIGQELARDGHAPRAASLLAELAALEPEASDVARIAALYGRLADDAGALPEVRATARLRLARLERARGNLNRQAAQLRRLGFVTGWRVIGPFDDEGKRGLSTVQPPERELALDAVQPGKGGDVAWRAIPPEAVDSGFVPVGLVLTTEQRVCAHALAIVESPRDERIEIWFGASGAARVLVNGVTALEDPGYHPARLDQRGAAVSLRRGANRLQVKLCNQDGTMGFLLRLVDGRGTALSLPNPVEGPLPAPLAPGPRPAPIVGVVAQLEGRANVASRGGGRSKGAEAEARLDLARALAAFEGADAEEHRALREARRAVELAPGSVAARLFDASLEEDESSKREQVAAALAAAPEDPRAMVAAAEVELTRGRPQPAVRLLERAVRVAPGYAAARTLLARALEEAGLESRGRLAALEAADLLPTSHAAVVAGAKAARRLGRLDQAAWLLRKAVALRFDDRESRNSLARLLLERGDVDGALALLVEGLRVRPGDVDALLRLADLLAANGRLDEAEARYAEAISIGGATAEPWERRARARLRAGREGEALADLRRALAIEPQRPAAKELLRSLEPKREPWEKPYLLDAVALAKKPDDGAPDDDAVILGELEVSRVLPTGLASSFRQEIARVRTQRGVEEWRRRTLSYTPDRQQIEIVRVRVVKPDGTTTETWDESESSDSEPWYRLYFDTRSRTILLPNLAVGDLVEVAWRVDDTARENLLADSWGDLTQIDGPTPIRRFDYVLIAPASRAIHANAPDGVRRTERPLGEGLVEHRWTVEGVAKTEAEPAMPPWIEVGRFLHVSTFASWEEVGRYYWGLVRDQLRPTPEVRATAERLAASALGRRAKATARTREETERLVEAVYAFVVTQIRYVGLEFGIHGYKPYRVDQVLQRRFGDCKDKASLLHALLEALGIDSRLVLLRMRRLGALPEAPASLAAFNHAILYVPSLDRWLDGTASYTGSRELPGEDRGASVLVVEPDGPSRFTRVPEATSSENVASSEVAITLALDGQATMSGKVTVSGVQAANYRRSYEQLSSRRALLEQAFGRTWPGARVDSVETTPLGRLEDPVTLSFRLSAPAFAQREGDGLRFAPFGSSRGYGERWAALASRRHPVVLGDPSETRLGYRVALPRGWEVVELPEGSSQEGPHVAYEVRYHVEPGAVVAEGRFTVRDGRVPVADYPAFRALTAAADAAFARTVRIAPAGRKGEAR